MSRTGRKKAASDAPQPISGDRPIEEAGADRLGFDPLAQRLATALVDQGSSEGLVVGLEGEWGSGKSSLLNLTARALKELPAKTRPVVVQFKPWLVGDRDALLRALFAQLANEVEKVEGETGSTDMADKRRRDEAAALIRTYARGAEVLGAVVSAIPGAGAVGKAVEQAGKAGKDFGREKPLPDLKRELEAALAKLNRRIVVTVDDVDRLEPRETMEVLRLVRSVADFRNVIYVLCFDHEIVSKSIEAAIQVSDGENYLEKILQVVVAVPIPEAFHLRRWLELELAPIARIAPEDAKQRLASVIDREGGRRLTTPRSVVRVLNAVRLLEPALRDEVDVSDLVWLQLIRGHNAKLYRWIESYCASAATNSSWRVSVSTDAKEKSFKKLRAILEKDDLDFASYCYELGEHLPGIRSLSWNAGKDEPPIFADVDQRSLQEALAHRRLASPDHYRLYFALGQPATSPRAEDFRRLLEAAETSTSAVTKLAMEWVTVSDRTVGTKLEVMLDRLQNRSAGALSSVQASNIFAAFADIMDEAGRIGGRDDFGSPAIWREAESSLASLLSAVEPDKLEALLIKAFGKGNALGWLSSLLRHETFAHGRFGDRRQPESEWLLSDRALDAVTKQMLRRYRKMSFAAFAALPNTLSTLFAWSQGGDPDGPKRLIAACTETDEGFVSTLEAMITPVQSSAGNYTTLARHNLASFLDYDAAVARATMIAEGNTALSARAKPLATYFAAARDF